MYFCCLPHSVCPFLPFENDSCLGQITEVFLNKKINTPFSWLDSLFQELYFCAPEVFIPTKQNSKAVIMHFYTKRVRTVIHVQDASAKKPAIYTKSIKFFHMKFSEFQSIKQQ